MDYVTRHYIVHFYCKNKKVTQGGLDNEHFSQNHR